MTRLCGMSPYDPHMPGPGDIYSPPEDDGYYCEHCHRVCSCGERDCPCPGWRGCECECEQCEQERDDDRGDYLYDEMVDRQLTDGDL